MDGTPNKISALEHVRTKLDERRTMTFYDRHRQPGPQYEADQRERTAKFARKGLSEKQSSEIGQLNMEIYTRDMTIHQEQLESHTLRLAPFKVRECLQYSQKEKIEKLKKERNDLLHQFNDTLRAFGLEE